MSLYDYVLGAVLGEMPASFSEEALKAQAVACRTYALWQYSHRKHDAAAVCTDSACCMRWVDPAACAASGDAAALARVKQAVEATDAVTVFYEDEPIVACFFSASGGRTESAEAVWGGAIPYLVSIDSPGEASPYETDTVSVSLADFCSILTAEEAAADFSDDPASWLGPVSYTDGGGVATMELGGASFSGVQLRRLFGLRSTLFFLVIKEDTVIFTTHGNGHRVGMSQYGAEALAKQGADYIEILTKYYPGTSVQLIQN